MEPRNAYRAVSILLITAGLSLLFTGCISYRSKESPRVPYLQKDLRYADQSPPILLIHTHKHLVNGAATEKSARKGTEKLYTTHLNTILTEFPFLRNANASCFDAPYTLQVETVNDEQANMGLVYLSGATFMVIPSTLKVAITVSASLKDNTNDTIIAEASSNGGTKTIIWLLFLFPWNLKVYEPALDDIYRDVLLKIEDQIKEKGFTGISKSALHWHDRQETIQSLVGREGQ
jgi:hypothetical protein